MSTDFGPDQLAISRLFPDDALIAKPVGVEIRLHRIRETFFVERGGARVAAEQIATVGAGEAEADVDVGGRGG